MKPEDAQQSGCAGKGRFPTQQHAPSARSPAPLAFRAARFSDGTLATERDGIVVAVYSRSETDEIQKLLGVRT